MQLFSCSTGFDAWMKHASGISRLMQARGPDRFRSVFDKTILEAFRGIIVRLLFLQ